MSILGIALFGGHYPNAVPIAFWRVLLHVSTTIDIELRSLVSGINFEYILEELGALIPFTFVPAAMPIVKGAESIN